MRRNRAKKFAKFPEFRRTARTKFACTRPAYVAQPAEQRRSSSPSLQCVQMQKSPSDAPRSRKSCAKIARNNCKISEKVRRAARTKNCMHSACVRCNSHDIFEALHQVMSALTSEQARVRRRDHANFAPKSRENFAKFPEFRRTARTLTLEVYSSFQTKNQNNIAPFSKMSYVNLKVNFK